MPDVFGAYDNMRVREYLDFFGAAYKIPRKDRKQRIDECMDITGSGYMKDRYVEALSHGMKQRVAIARTLLHDPEVLILDEPANGLDPNARIEMRGIILRLAEMGKTIIVTSHILPELSRICDTVAIITHGKLRAFGPLETIMKNLAQRRKMEVVLLNGQHAATRRRRPDQDPGRRSRGHRQRDRGRGSLLHHVHRHPAREAAQKTRRGRRSDHPVPRGAAGSGGCVPVRHPGRLAALGRSKR